MDRRSLLGRVAAAGALWIREPWTGRPLSRERSDEGPVTQARSVHDGWINAKTYGASGNGLVDDAPALQAAIDACAAAGGVLLVPAGVYLVGTTIRLPSRVSVVGEGRWATTLKLANGRNVDVIQTAGFQGLTGRNVWLAAGGVPYGFGLLHLGIDGGTPGNAVGRGLALYGKGYLIYDVRIQNCAGAGFYSECGTSANVRNMRDEPEALVDLLYVANCGGHGIEFRGPHDSRFGLVVAHANGGWGFVNESGGGHLGQCEVERLHTYVNHVGGIRIGVGETFVGFAYTDTEPRGLEILGDQVSVAEWFGNQGSGLRVVGSKALVSIAQANLGSEPGGVGLHIAGDDCTLGLVEVVGGEATGQIGVDIDGSGTRVLGGHVAGLRGPDSVGLRYGHGARGVSFGNVSLQLNNCATGFEYASAGVHNRFELSMFVGRGQLDMTGGGPGPSDSWEISEGGAVASARSTSRVLSEPFLIDSLGTRRVEVRHGLVRAPRPQSIQLTVIGDSAVADWAYDLLMVDSFDDQSVTAIIRVSRPSATTGAQARLAFYNAIY